MAKLRIGHVRLQEYLNKFGMSESPMCLRCNNEERDDVHHYLLNCVKHQEARTKVVRSLRNLGLNQPTVKDLLGEGEHDKETNHKITNILARYLLETDGINFL